MNFESAEAAWADVENGTIKLATTIVVRISDLRTIPSFRRRGRRTSGPASAGVVVFAGLPSLLDGSGVELRLYQLLEHGLVPGVPEVGMEGAAGRIAHHVGGQGAPRRDAVRDPVADVDLDRRELDGMVRGTSGLVRPVGDVAPMV